jgi:hypothetical protein
MQDLQRETRQPSMRIGVDFDNTIVCYDRLFHRAAVDRSLIPVTLPMDKESVRNYLRQLGREDEWTELQGLVYGERINEAEPFPGVAAFFLECRRQEIPVYVVSHKTRWPVRGPRVDLHQAARGWLESHRFHDNTGIGLAADRVLFAETKQGKLQTIGDLNCTHFIDDLPEFLLEPDFPAGVERMLFDPWNRYAGRVPLASVPDWETARRNLLARHSP